MTCETIRSVFSSAVRKVAASISSYVTRPGVDMTRSRKLPPDRLLTFLVSEGSLGTKNELLDFFGLDPDGPSASAFCQQRGKLKPEAVEAVFREFSSLAAPPGGAQGYDFVAADGSTATFQSLPKFVPDEYFVSGGHSAKGFYSIHINALYDLASRTYTDAVLQPVHEKDEFAAFCRMADRCPVRPGRKTVFIGDRGYCSYNNMAHVIEKGQYFLFRTKDIHSKGLIGKFEFPDQDEFGITVKVTLVRSHSKKLQAAEGYTRFVDKAASFDFSEYGSADTYALSFRIARFRISDKEYECIVTNLPADEFPAERIRELYFMRWGEETSFRKLKYTIGLSNFHAMKPEFIKQEIWARLTAYNVAERLAGVVPVEQHGNKYEYRVNFSVAAHICRFLLRPAAEEENIDAARLLQRATVPVRDGRKYKRLKTAHFRKPRHCTYRAS